MSELTLEAYTIGESKDGLTAIHGPNGSMIGQVHSEHTDSMVAIFEAARAHLSQRGDEGEVTWVTCPLCGENDMRCVTNKDEPDLKLIYCVNHYCPSNGGNPYRPRPDDEQMREALTIADEHKDDEYYCNIACEEWTELALVSRALLAMSDKLAELQNVECALSGLVELKDRKDRIGKDDEYRRLQPIRWTHAREALEKARVCKPVGDG